MIQRETCRFLCRVGCEGERSDAVLIIFGASGVIQLSGLSSVMSRMLSVMRITDVWRPCSGVKMDWCAV